MKISISEKERAPDRFLVHRGLEWGDGARLGTSRRLPAEKVIPASDNQEQTDARNHDVADLVAVILPESAPDQMANDETCAQYSEIHLQPPQGTVFSVAKLSQRLSSSYEFNNITNVAYISLKVKRNRKSLYFKAFSRISYWIKKFSSPKMRNREFSFEPKMHYARAAEHREAASSDLQLCRGWESNPHEGF